jgi:hypothetical protein
MKKLILSFIVILSAFIGCEKEKPPVYSSSLIGKWSWLSTCGGIAGTCYTPKTTQTNINLIFTKDSICYTYRNDTLRYTVRIHTYKVITQFNDTVNILTQGVGVGIDQSFSIIHDTLSLNDYMVDDGFGSIYKRN